MNSKLLLAQSAYASSVKARDETIGELSRVQRRLAQNEKDVEAKFRLVEKELGK